jgi:hypothetical protein
VLNIAQTLAQEDGSYVVHPRSQLDVVCVADLATWTTAKTTFLKPFKTEAGEWFQGYGPSGSAATSFMGHTQDLSWQVEHFTPVGGLISTLIRRLAWEKPELRQLADYYRIVDISGAAKGTNRFWPSSIYSEGIRLNVEAGVKLSNGEPWDEWGISFF